MRHAGWRELQAPVALQGLVFKADRVVDQAAEKQGGDGDGPKAPDVSRPDTQELLKKMRKVDPNQSKRYRQRTGQ